MHRAALIILLITTSLFAEEAIELPAVQVQDSNESSDYIATQDTFSYLHLNTEEYKRQHLSLEELLSRQTGLQVRSGGGQGSFSQASIRGSSGRQVMIYLDGIPINGSDGSAIDLSSFTLEQIGEIEIYKNIVPSHLSGTGIGGAINLKSAIGSIPKTAYKATYGSFNTKNFSISNTGKTHALTHALSYQYKDAKNNYDYKKNTAANELQERRNNAVTSQHVNGGLTWTPSQAHKWKTNFQYLDKNNQIPNRQNLNSDTTLTKETWKLGINYIFNLPTGFNSNSRMNLNKSSSNYDDSLKSIGFTPVENNYKTDSNNLFQSFSYQYKYGKVSANADIKNEEFKLLNNEFQTGTQNITKRSEDSYKRTQLSSAIDHTLFLGNSFVASSAYKVISIKDKHDTKTFKDSFNTTQLGLSYSPLNHIKIHAAINKELRIPSFSELYANLGLMTANPDLKPERSNNIEAGFEWHGKTLFLSSTLFKRNIEDAITITYDARGLGQSQNYAKATVTGWENTLTLTYPLFSLSVKSTNMDSKITSDMVAFDEHKLPGFYHHSYIGNMSYFDGPWKVGLNFIQKYDLRWTATLGKEGNFTDYRSFDMDIQYQADDWGISLDFKNITDIQQEEFYRQVSPGRSLYLTLSYNH